MLAIIIRDESPSAYPAISSLITRAFENDPISDKREAQIVDQLRADEALDISLVATLGDSVVGHIAFSKVTIDGEFCGWFGLAPVSVLPEHQGKGIGSALVNEGLARLKTINAKGCVLLGSPDYYHRFGFQPRAGLKLAGVAARYFQALSFTGSYPCGTVSYHPALS